MRRVTLLLLPILLTLLVMLSATGTWPVTWQPEPYRLPSQVQTYLNRLTGPARRALNHEQHVRHHGRRPS